MSTANKIRNDSAHELFHAVQNQYYYTAGMAQRFWFMEGTPDFMAYRYGWNGSIQSQIEPLTLSWFEHSPFENLTDVDAYPLGNFLEYLSTVKSVNLKKLWDDVAGWAMNVPQGFRSAVSDQTGMSFDTTWNEFIEYAVFGKPALATKSMRVLTVDKASIEESRSYTLKEGYTMTLVEVRAQACAPGGTRKIRVSTSGAYTGSSKVALWKADPAGSNRVFVDYLNAGRLQSDWIDLDDSKRVFALLSNNGAAEIAASLTVQAQDCSTLPSFSRSYTGLNVYNQYTKADVSFELTGAYLSVREGFLPGMVGLLFKVPQPEPGKSMSFRLSAMPSNLVCLNPNPCPIDWKIDFASMGWGTTYANGSGAVTTLVIDQSKCWASSDFSYKVLKPPYFDVAFPLAVEVNGCP